MSQPYIVHPNVLQAALKRWPWMKGQLVASRPIAREPVDASVFRFDWLVVAPKTSTQPTTPDPSTPTDS